MRLSSLFIAGSTFLLAAGLSLVAAGFAVTAIEDISEIGVRRVLDDARLNWAEVEADGLKVILAGMAPDEATRLDALSKAGSVIDAARLINAMDVTPTANLAPPRFSAEILRNDGGISIIGLIPAATDRAALMVQLNDIAGSENVADLLESADYPVPSGWEDALGFAVSALSRLPRSKISVDAGHIEITAISDSLEAKAALERALNRAAPPGLRMEMTITAPRPVITPFTLRFLIDDSGARFDACSADTEASGARIVAAARRAGLADDATSCTVGMGVPSPNWAEAAALSIDALADMGAGSVTFSDADISLIAAVGTGNALFDRVVGELETALPEVFALHAMLPEPENETDTVAPEFVATLSPEGQVQLRGRLSDENLRLMADSYARARFGSDSVYTATRITPDLPADWPVRVLAGLEVLSELTNGAVTVTPDNLTVRGSSANEEASTSMARLLSDKLGDSQSYALDITYRPPPEPVDKPPSPEECEALIDAIQQDSKITFEPGSATITAASAGSMDAIAGILTRCGDIRLEIQGHTDSQGRESMNQQLSQARAQSVLNELRARRVLTATYVAVGYGETRPIADNGSDIGREKNRRIEFRLIRPDAIPEEVTTLEGLEAGAAAETATGEKPHADADAPTTETPAAAADTPHPETTAAQSDAPHPENATGSQADAPHVDAPAESATEDSANEQN
jgi:OmpA-OmpF porin, OOP family